MRRVDSTLINARIEDNEAIVGNARFIESLEAEGKSAESLLSDARKVLEISEDDSVTANAQDGIKKQYALAKSLRDLVNFTEGAKKAGLLEEGEVRLLGEIESRIAEKVAAKYDLEVEDLIIEEE